MSSTPFTLTARDRPSALRALRTGLRTRLALVAAAVTFVIAWSGLLITHSQAPVAIPKSIALHQVLSDPATARMLASVHWDHVGVTPMDSRYEILEFYRGPRLVAAVTAGWAGRVMILASTDGAKQSYDYGSNIANDPRLLALLSVVFVLMTAVWPLWRLRNLDVLVVLSLTLSVVLYNAGLLTSMVLVTFPALIYLASRCAWRGLGRPREPLPAMPLYERVAGSLSATQRMRLLRMAVATLALITAMVGFTSLHVLDVGYAVMEGATLLVHGILPYGHIPDVLHGDTYPLGSYLMYVPLALFWPVHTVWDDADVTLVVAIVAVLLGASWLSRLAATRRRTAIGADAGTEIEGKYAERSGGLRAAIAMMAFPPVLVTVSTGTTDVTLAAMLVAAFLVWHRPARGAAALAAAAWFKLTPVLLLPLWLARLRGRALAKAVAAIVAVTATFLAILLALGGVAAPLAMARAISFQFTRSSPQTLWTLVGSIPLQQLAQAATLALLVGACVRIRRDSELARDRWRTAAIAAAVLLGVQISASYWTYMYLVWAFPFVALALLIAGPEVTDARPLGDDHTAAGYGSSI